MHSPLLETYTRSQAPYRNIGGTLHSPILDSLSSDYFDDDGNFANWSLGDFKALLGIMIPFFMVVIVVAVFWSMSKPVTDLWPEGEYYRLSEGLKYEANGEFDRAKQSLEAGLVELASSRDERADMSRIRILYNLGRMENNIDLSAQAKKHLSQAHEIMQRQDGGPDSTEDAGILTERAKSSESLNDLSDSEKDLKKSIEIYLQNGVEQSNSEMQTIVESLIDILKKENKLEEALRYETMLNPTDLPQATPTNTSSDKQSEASPKLMEKAKKLIPLKNLKAKKKKP